MRLDQRLLVLVVWTVAAAAMCHTLGLQEEEEEGGSPVCPGLCRCEGDGILLPRVDCADLGLSQVPADLSVFTSYLDLSMNNFTILPPRALSSLHFLEELRLAGNELTDITEETFAGLYNLRVLMLQNNQLRSVPDKVFQSLPNLQSLRLDANHISSVPIGSFSGLHSLRHLWLDDNWLSEVPVRALSHVPALQAITLALNHVTHIPDHAFSNLSSLVVLHLNNNRIVTMGTSCFHGLHSLETLDLNYNSLVEFPMAISSLSHLKELGFHSNSIQSIPEHAFSGNPSLVTIFFYDNPIQSVGRSAFENLPELRTLSLNGAADLTEFPDLSGTQSLESLTITGALIVSLPPSFCDPLSTLRLLDLSYNHLRSLPSLSACESLQKIDLHHNQIEELQANTFHGLMALESIDLSWNKISSVAPDAFSGLPALVKLDLSSNQLSSLPLIGLQSLSHLRLAGNSELMEMIPRDSLPRVRLMELPYAFQCCVFVSCERRGGGGGGRADAVSPWYPEDVVAPGDDTDWEHFLLDDEQKTPHTVQCSPAPGPFKPCLSLFGSWLIRSGVWLITALSLVSNGLVMLSVFLSPSSWATPPKLLIGWLALVNSLMGVWTGWLAVVDGWTYSTFWRYGAQWECSFLCRFSGFLCVFASQTGLFLLTLAVMERSVMATAPAQSAAAPPGRWRWSEPEANAPSPHKSLPDCSRERDAPPSPPPPFSLRLAVALCFLLGLAVALPPLVAGGGTAALCLPLPSSSSSSSSIASSVSLLLLDAGCFLAMTLAYTRLYCRAAHGSKAPVPMATASSPWEREEEAALTRHVAWLLFSDCLLFLPVAFASSSSLLRLSAAAGPEVLKGVLLLVVPLPACVNPLLYLLFSRAAHQDLRALGKRLRRALAGLRGAPWGRTHGGGRAAGAEAWYDDDEDAEKQSCDSTQALVALGSVGEEEEEEEEEEQRGGDKQPPVVACVAPCY